MSTSSSTHCVVIDGVAKGVTVPEGDSAAEAALTAAAIGRAEFLQADVLVFDIAHGAAHRFTATDCEEWFA